MYHRLSMENQTLIAEFTLIGLSSDPQAQILLFFMFLVIYAVTFLANSMIMLIITKEASLHTPMFFFLNNLALVDICYSSVTLPKIMESSVAERKSISVVGCYTQVFLIIHFACVEIHLLTAMAYDRYAAICDPLRYSTIMRKERCNQLVGGAWVLGFLDGTINTLPLLNAIFCGQNRISHSTCDLPAVLSLSCSENILNYLMIVVSCLLFGFPPLLLTLFSYIKIISTILKIHSVKGRSKAFSTCSSHLIVVCLFYFTVFSQYLKTSSNSLSDLDRVISFLYLTLSPLLNPIIYCLRNNEIKAVLKKRYRKCR